MSTSVTVDACHDYDPSIGRRRGLDDPAKGPLIGHSLYGFAFSRDRSVLRFRKDCMVVGDRGLEVSDRLVDLANARHDGALAGELFRARELVYDAAHCDPYPEQTR